MVDGKGCLGFAGDIFLFQFPFECFLIDGF